MLVPDSLRADETSPSAALCARVPPSASGRQEIEGVTVPRANHSEVPVIDGRDPGDIESFGDGDHRGVSRSGQKVRVGPDELSHPGQITSRGGLQPQLTAGQGVPRALRPTCCPRGS
jgi:hypothetical protein